MDIYLNKIRKTRMPSIMITSIYYVEIYPLLFYIHNKKLEMYANKYIIKSVHNYLR